MTVNAIVGLVLPAALFAIVYFPAVTQLSMAVVSPYGKADLKKRLFALAIDGFVVLTAWFLYTHVESSLFLVAGAAYILLRDAMQGQSLGKLLMGLVVVSVETGRPIALKGSVYRNVVLVLPGVNVVALFLEPITVFRDPQGQRLGDRLAQTQVVEGLGVRDLATFSQQWLGRFVVDLNAVVRKPGREPGEIRRAQAFTAGAQR
jgi:uncharacterized RDD family membrane protein YckC